jgi:two-component sensor histidine kinase
VVLQSSNSVCDEETGAEEWFGTDTDVHELRRALERQQVLVRELHHRTKNLLAIVGAIARQTLRGSNTLAEFEEKYGQRLQALDRFKA